MVNLKVDLAGMILDNPVIPSSGTFGYGLDHARYYDLNILGSIAIKGTTLNPRFGNPTPRVAECASGAVCSIGLQNPGVDEVVKTLLPELKKYYRKKVIANACGFSAEEFAEVAARFDASDSVGIIEVNVSCPNVESGLSFGSYPNTVYEVTKKVRKRVKKAVFVKLSPMVADIKEIACAAEEAGADGVTLINAAPAMRIDIKTKKPVLANKKGGLSGKALFPVALRCVYDVYGAVKIPVVGVGGISSAEDVIEMMYAGATAVGVGAENLVEPFACKKIIEELPAAAERCGLVNLADATGAAHR